MTAIGRVGRYEIRREIGRGGMATVYLAYQPDLDREVALKALRVGEAGDARRFLREARLASSLVHPSIVTVHDYFEDAGTPYIAMEYLPRGALRAHVGRLTLAQIGGVLESVLGGLAFAAERGVVHRDLKPENIMVSDLGRAKVADFGIAKATSSATANLTTAGVTLGTPRYMAPERALGQDVGPSSDLYSVGVIAFELLVGRTPFDETVEPVAVLMRQINDPVPPVISLVPDVGSELSGWVARLVEKTPAERTASAVVAWDELEAILLDQLGPRWSRAATLPARPAGQTSPMLLVTGRTPQRGAGGGRRAAAAVGEPARTLAPSTVPLARRRRRRFSLAVIALVAMGIALAAVTSDRLRDRGTTPSEQLGTQVSDRRADLAAARSNGDRASAADALAGEYAHAAAGASPSKARRLRRIADAYGRAAEAARREDGSDYDDALATARRDERALGAGDSESDGGGENEPDENDNGD
ncbi:protein kinase [Solirubrobacter ginsenosidimutans]|uniref:non-specific serine/threonine protein kinase n=1 Tax=Solirubrobacter ginsenosidimutans TaxID=490573 RepID=A0A9X3S0C8_9ACTN|nr:serine/threonine-protein kinase [Solirubrobacter ginsenosidimutans]MDA0159902.1 protein kinase [Solirubrobacter ginsenosidimutans]